ncbi:helix-turn-helix domain-containing protein [Chryseobacterium sp. SG20098]|uniref:helix-turn-helix domain-containing protein n=1 Tax=Chryseobacterium sp. SG20098 TaxID=3074145 RepID=UPI002882F0E0|nr:helix-turn-helix domain-containing protein [Chryseobacterium sp. SG20098]WNI39010.1 helix-turn-helix domain-containing protein [Chryseobacterium sp. SG20098]
MNLNKIKNSRIEMLLLAVMEELRNEIEEIVSEKTADLITKINVIDEKTAENLLSIKETAEFLGVSTATLWRMRKADNIPEYMIGAQVYFKRSEILKSLIPVN